MNLDLIESDQRQAERWSTLQNERKRKREERKTQMEQDMQTREAASHARSAAPAPAMSPYEAEFVLQQASSSTGATQPSVVADIKPVEMILKAFEIQEAKDGNNKFIKRHDLTVDKYGLLPVENEGIKVASGRVPVVSAVQRQTGKVIHKPANANGTADTWASILPKESQFVIIPKKLSSWTEGSAGQLDVTELQNAGIKKIPAYGPTITDIASSYGLNNNIHSIKETGQQTLQASNGSATLTTYEPRPVKGCKPDCSFCFSASSLNTIKGYNAAAEMALQQLEDHGMDVSKAREKLSEL